MKKITSAKLNKIVHQNVMEWLNEYGFPVNKDGYIYRWKDQRYIGLLVEGWSRGGENLIVPTGYLAFFAPAQIYEFYMRNRLLGLGATVGHLVADLRGFRGEALARYTCNTEDELGDVLSQLKSFIFDEVMPFFDSIQTHEQVLPLLMYKEQTLGKFSVPEWVEHSTPIILMIYARLYEPQRYEELKKRYLAIYEPYTEDFKENLGRLIQYLDRDELPELGELT